jgi:hypothetical protein
MLEAIPLWVRGHRHLGVLGLSLVLLFHTFGCASLRYAGAPPPSYDVDEDLRQLAEHFKPATAVESYYALPAPTPKDRNTVISARLVMINLEYLKWLRTVTADKQLLDTATDVLNLSLNLAATVTGGETAKTVLSAVSAGVTGSKASIDKHYFYEKTMPALVAAMNAQRKVVLARILDGMKSSLEDYPFEEALTDVYEYYQAGTFTGAITAIQADAGSKEKKADDKILKLSKPTPDEKEAVKTLQPVWVKLYSDAKAGPMPPDEANTLRKALQSLGADAPPADRDVLDRLHRLLQEHEKTAVEILKALKAAGYPGL